MITLLDIQSRHPGHLDQRVYDRLKLTAPEIDRAPARVVQGTTYKFLHRDTAPRLGFRPANTGVQIADAQKVVMEMRECFILQTLIGVDKAMAQGYPGGWQAIMTDEVMAHIKGFKLSMGLQFWYGHRIDNVGFPGIFEQMGDYMTLHANASKNVDNSTNRADQSGMSAVFLVEDPEYYEMIFGMNQGLHFDAVRDADLPRIDRNKKMGILPCKVQDASTWVGLAGKSPWMAGRLKCIKDYGVEDGDPSVITDDKLAELRSYFPAGVKPTALYMPTKAGRILQKSRSKALTYNNGDTVEVTAAWPTKFGDIPIIYTDALLEDESDASLAKVKSISEFASPRIATLQK